MPVQPAALLQPKILREEGSCGLHFQRNPRGLLHHSESKTDPAGQQLTVSRTPVPTPHTHRDAQPTPAIDRAHEGAPSCLVRSFSTAVQIAGGVVPLLLHGGVKTSAPPEERPAPGRRGPTKGPSTPP